MSQSFASLLVHVVFSTKHRERWPTDVLRDELHAYIGGILEAHHGVLLKAGYGLFSISPNHRAALEKYIGNQAEHHRTTTFQEEYLRLLRRNGIEWDERYVWD